MEITQKSLELFLDYANDARNWNGNPLLGGNVHFTKEDRGNLTQLKVAGLVETEIDLDDKTCTWLYFTDTGKALATEHGIDLGERN